VDYHNCCNERSQLEDRFQVEWVLQLQRRAFGVLRAITEQKEDAADQQNQTRRCSRPNQPLNQAWIKRTRHNHDPHEHGKSRQQDASCQQPRALRMLTCNTCEGQPCRRGRCDAARNRSHGDALAFAKDADSDVAAKRHSRDQDCKQPDLGGIDDVPRIDRSVGKDRKQKERHGKQR